MCLLLGVRTRRPPILARARRGVFPGQSRGGCQKFRARAARMCLGCHRRCSLRHPRVCESALVMACPATWSALQPTRPKQTQPWGESIHRAWCSRWAAPQTSPAPSRSSPPAGRRARLGARAPCSVATAQRARPAGVPRASRRPFRADSSLAPSMRLLLPLFDEMMLLRGPFDEMMKRPLLLRDVLDHRPRAWEGPHL